MTIDYDFIKQLEGNKITAYIPRDSSGNIIGQSGVTIGAGIDLGNFGNIDQLDISNKIKAKLRQYEGLRRELAEQMLKDFPLKLTEEEVSKLNAAVIDYYTTYIKDQYELESAKKWQDLSDRQQTVITSVLYQYGTPTRVPKFWAYVTSGNWSNVITELKDFGDKFTSRRHREAAYLENDHG